jgi:hypothetical protein
MKNSNDTIRNRDRYLPACVTVPQPTAPPRAPTSFGSLLCFKGTIYKVNLVVSDNSALENLRVFGTQW